MQRLRFGTIGAIALYASALSSGAQAEEASSCMTPRFADVGWTDITATTALSSILLETIGYHPKTTILSVPVTLQSLASGQIDVFLGNWMPTQESMLQPYLSSGEIEKIGTNLDKARVGLAVVGAAPNVLTYADIAKNKDAFNGRIYGIEAGSSANAVIDKMIKSDTFGLKDFQLVESSEQAMLAQVQSAERKRQPILFFAWTPHPMNIRYPLTFLKESGDAFGPNDGEVFVNTLSRKKFAQDCPNLNRFVTNLRFNVDMESKLMNSILTDGLDASEAAVTWLKDNPLIVKEWLKGVTTADGKDALPVVKTELGL